MQTEVVRVRLGANAATEPAALVRLAHDPSVTVRASLAMNPAAPAEAHAVLARDPDERVRALLARKLGVLVPTLSPGERETLHNQTWSLLTLLAEDEAERVRAAIAEEVKDLPDAPRELILHLARDPVVTVCEPVILFSPMLTPADLVALVASAPSATREAVARRSNLPETVSDAIAETADGEAIRALLNNQSAQIREATLDALIARSADHEAWHDPLVRRPVLSPQATRALSEIVASHLLEVLATRTDVGEDFRQRLRARLGGTTPINAPSGNGPFEPEAADTDQVADRLMQAARAGDIRLAISVLAARAGVAASLVEQAATLRSAKALVALTWKAGLPMRVAVAMQTLLAKVAPGAVIPPGPGDSFPLAVEEMKWQIEFLTTAAASEPAAKAWFSGGSGSRAPSR